MCWFHVEFNVGIQIQKKQIPEELISMIKADIKMLHNSLSESEYVILLGVVHAR